MHTLEVLLQNAHLEARSSRRIARRLGVLWQVEAILLLGLGSRRLRVLSYRITLVNGRRTERLLVRRLGGSPWPRWLRLRLRLLLGLSEGRMLAMLWLRRRSLSTILRQT